MIDFATKVQKDRQLAALLQLLACLVSMAVLPTGFHHYARTSPLVGLFILLLIVPNVVAYDNVFVHVHNVPLRLASYFNAGMRSTPMKCAKDCASRKNCCVAFIIAYGSCFIGKAVEYINSTEPDIYLKDIKRLATSDNCNSATTIRKLLDSFGKLLFLKTCPISYLSLVKRGIAYCG
ncbi:hypothetical protein Tcan_14369 [Toxocara canis]|uniref:Uncharacterized protein n=1 Tax=Toxocara canis TaxID=6265 RepID=A0A0B2W5I5_TOXCA|nr:hypothetical protein Tcan_14369 [Toxocara canis]